MTFWKKYKPFIIHVAVTLAFGGLATLLGGDQALYAELEKPPLSPPSWVFPVVWTILYILIGIAAGLVARSDDLSRGKALTWYYIQLGINVLWPFWFFRLEMITVAMVWLGILVVAVVITWRLFREISSAAGWLLVPYLLWCLFALYLNIGFVLLN